MAKPPIFICFTGIDGSGKSSHAQLLRNYLQTCGITSTYTWSRWEPYLIKPFIRAFKGGHVDSEKGSPDAQNLRIKKKMYLNNPFLLWSWLSLSLLDYYWQVRRRVICYMISDNIVICDRYLFDYAVDQAVNMGKGTEGINRIFGSRLIRLFPLPDLLFILDVEPTTGYRRKQDGTSVEYLTERRELYLNFRNLPYAIAIDANTSIDVITEQIKDYTISFLKNRGLIRA